MIDYSSSPCVLGILLAAAIINLTTRTLQVALSATDATLIPRVARSGRADEIKRLFLFIATDNLALRERRASSKPGADGRLVRSFVLQCVLMRRCPQIQREFFCRVQHITAVARGSVSPQAMTSELS